MSEPLGEFSKVPDRGMDVSNPHRAVVEEAQKRLAEVGGPEGKVGFAGTLQGDVVFVFVENPTAAEGQERNHLFVGPADDTHACSDVETSGIRQGASIVSGIETVEQDDDDPLRFVHVVSYQGEQALWGVAQIEAGQDQDDVIDEIVGDFEGGNAREDDQWGTVRITPVPMPQ